MVTAIAKAYDVVSFEDIEPGPEHDGRVPLNIRRHFGIQGFGVRANRSVGDGHVVGEHDEVGLSASGQEELYLVLSGKATFNVDGEPIYATAGTMVFVRDPAAKRSAVAEEEGTTILTIGGTPGRAYELSVGEAMNDMWDPYRAENFEGALEALQRVLKGGPRRSSSSTSPAWRQGSAAPTMQSAICSRRSRTMIGSRSTFAATRT
jgi:hypothetical protein